MIPRVPYLSTLFWTAGCLAAGLLALPPQVHGFSPKRQASPAPEQTESPTGGERTSTRLQPLSIVMERSLTGLDFEPAEYREWMGKKAQEYLSLQSKQPVSNDFKTALTECSATETRHPFCELLENPGAAQKRLGDIPTSTLARRKQQKLQAVRALLRKQDLTRLEASSERDVRAALREVRSFDVLKKLTERVLAETESCSVPKLSFVLGGKVEEFLPEPEMRQTAIALYGKSASCEYSQSPQARYRMSLLQIWAGDCASAVPHLEHLAYNSKTRDFRSRALFWKAECSGKLGEKESVAAAKRHLRDNHPFSLHTLLSQNDAVAEIRTLLSGTDSMVRFRSVARPELNGLTTAAEALVTISKDRAAEKLLGAIGSQMEDTEPEFQLYIAYLLNRVGDFLGKFRVMSQLLHENPTLISWSSLGLYYPRSELNTDIVRKAGLDELLVLSLIRQESAFNERAHSRAGARGLMQVMPATARLVEKRRVSVKDLYNPDINLKIGSKYFANLLKKYNGDAELALAAYNAGPKRVEEWLRRYPVENRMLFLDLVPFRETREYVAAIARNFFWYSLLYSEQSPDTAPTPTENTQPEPRQTAESPPFPGSLRNVFKLFGT